MSIDVFGYQAMSASELITDLQNLIDNNPDLADQPVWLSNVPPLLRPVNSVSVSADGHSTRINLTVAG